MFRAFAFCSLLTAGLTCYSQSVNLRPSTIPGIEIIGAQSPDFAAQVSQIVGAEQPGGLMDWLPYGVVVKNNSSQALAAMAVVFTPEMPSAFGGADLTPDWFIAPDRRVKPGQSVLVIPAAVLAQPRDLRPFSLGSRTGNLSNYQRTKGLEISIAGVVFGSGQFVGLDEHHEYEQWQARIDAPRNVAATLLEKKAGTAVSDILAWLQTVADGGLLADTDSNAIYRSFAARGLLRVYQNNGEGALYSLAENTLREPVFPLHR